MALLANNVWLPSQSVQRGWDAQRCVVGKEYKLTHVWVDFLCGCGVFCEIRALAQKTDGTTWLYSGGWRSHRELQVGASAISQDGIRYGLVMEAWTGLRALPISSLTQLNPCWCDSHSDTRTWFRCAWLHSWEWVMSGCFESSETKGVTAPCVSLVTV